MLQPPPYVLLVCILLHSPQSNHRAVVQARNMDLSNPVNPAQTPSSSAATNTASVRRGGNYTVEEDIAITRAYIHVSMDPITGTDQKEATYYSRIWEAYKTKKPSDAVSRPLTSVTTRCKTILKESVRFAACFKSIESMRKSGHSDDDNVRLATALFNKKKVSHPREDVGKPFRFTKCWEILRDLPKFSAAAEGGSSSGSGSYSVSGAEAGEPHAGVSTSDGDREKKEKKERPDGRRKAKEELAAQHVRAKKLKLAEQAVRLLDEQVQALNKRNEILLFTNGPGGADSDMAREYFSLKQAEALQKLKESMRGKEAEKATNTSLNNDAADDTDS